MHFVYCTLIAWLSTEFNDAYLHAELLECLQDVPLSELGSGKLDIGTVRLLDFLFLQQS